MPQVDELEIEVFRAGDYGARGAYSQDDLDGIATRYDPAMHEAPVTLDHDQRGPAHGWVAGLRRAGDRLVARLARLSPALVEAIRTGAFRKRSVELYRAFGDSGLPYLKAVSFLGAAAPAVRGLADPQFREDASQTVCFTEPSPLAAAEDARGRLLAAGRWHPAWDAAGLPEVFAELAHSPALGVLERALAATTPPVELGPHAAPAEAARFSDSLHGIAPTPESAALHRRALARMNADPGLAYTDAVAMG